jgi:5-formyltetrahydrofolate cyclo-ligase
MAPAGMDPVDPRLLAEITERAKRQIRSRMRSLRGAHPPAALAERNARIVARLRALPELDHARSVASFWPMTERHEIDLGPLDAYLREQHKNVYYPGLAAGAGGAVRTGMRLTRSSDELIVRGGRFAEPPPEAPEAARGEIDLLVVPALAVAANGHRIGYGAGFYDAALPDYRPPALAVVVAYDFQLLAEVPTLSHDVPCDIVVTDARTIVVARPDESPPGGAPSVRRGV